MRRNTTDSTNRFMMDMKSVWTCEFQDEETKWHCSGTGIYVPRSPTFQPFTKDDTRESHTGIGQHPSGRRNYQSQIRNADNQNHGEQPVESFSVSDVRTEL